MGAYKLPIDVMNRALQHMHMHAVGRLDESTPNAYAVVQAYDRVREAELSNNLWKFSLKRVVLRPVQTQAVYIDTSSQTTSGAVLHFTSTTDIQVGLLVTGTNIPASTTVEAYDATTVTLSASVSGTVASGATITFGSPTFLYTPPTYAAGTTYSVGSIVADTNGDWWRSRKSSNIGRTPSTSPVYWSVYVGVDVAQPFDTGFNSQSPTSYYTGELVMTGGAVYLSLNSNNSDTPPSVNWLNVNGTTEPLSILWPIGTGPATDFSTNNVFRLPRGYLRRAPTSPNSGLNDYLGADHSMPLEDYVMEGDYIVSGVRNSILVRYVGDVKDVSEMDATFCEMLAARIAVETCTAPGFAIETKVAGLIMTNCNRHYNRERRSAVEQNAVEIGPIDPPLDEYLRVRYL